MIYTEITVKAMKIAYKAHLGQVDDNGVPYIFHPYHIAEQMDEEISCAVALLHDVVEDTEITIKQLEKEFPQIVTEAIRILTHNKDIDYFEYIDNIKQNPIATKVKLEDLAHNLDESRNVNGSISKEKIQYRRKKYTKARSVLLVESKD